MQPAKLVCSSKRSGIKMAKFQPKVQDEGRDDGLREK